MRTEHFGYSPEDIGKNEDDYMNTLQKTLTDAPNTHIKVKYENGYGASVVRNPNSYGYPHCWELAVTKDDELCYSTEITNDVMGWLTTEEIAPILLKIKTLI